MKKKKRIPGSTATESQLKAAIAKLRGKPNPELEKWRAGAQERIRLERLKTMH